MLRCPDALESEGHVAARLRFLPGGTPVYDLLQRTMGGLRRFDVMRKLAFQRNLCALMVEHGFRPRGARLVEVGTGWIPLDAVGFWMCGAARVVTLDLNRLLDVRLLGALWRR